MNYRHIYHAGNFADIHKHLVMLMVTKHLQQKDTPFFVLDAFAGVGLYDLNSEQAQKTRESEAGIGQLMAAQLRHQDLRDIADVMRPEWDTGHYAGSPLLLARLLRGQDRLVANELHPEDFEELAQNLKRIKNTRATCEDAYQSIRAHIPPPEKRGLILIDPPFEKPDEFDLLVKNMKDWKKRWSTGVYMIWYPIKAGGASERLHAAASELGINRTWVSEILLRGRNLAGSLNGAGLVIFNTPYMIPERMGALADEFSIALGQGCWLESHYLTNE